jgi:hypothetical protein
LHIFFKEDAPGQFRFLAGDVVGPRGNERVQMIRHVQHDLIWRENAMSQEVEAGKLLITFQDGTSKELQLRTRAGRLFLKGGLYGGLNGWFQGEDKGDLHVGFETWDLDNPEHRRIARTLAEQVVEISDGNESGLGTLQCGVGKGYPKYTEVQIHPAQ